MRSLSKQLLRFATLKNENEQLPYYTGLSRQYWDALCAYLQLSVENVLSMKSADFEERGRLICPGSGRKSSPSLEDELLLTLMRLRLGRSEKELSFRILRVTGNCFSHTLEVDKLLVSTSRSIRSPFDELRLSTGQPSTVTKKILFQLRDTP